MFLYADDAKLCRNISSQEDNLSLQRAIYRFKNCSDTCLLELDISKCKVFSYSMTDRLDTDILYHTRECGNYSDLLPLKAARRDSICNLTSCGASNLSRKQIQLEETWLKYLKLFTRNMMLPAPQGCSSITLVDTRGNKYKLFSKSFHYDVWKYSFIARIINTWNSLPNKIVDAKSVNIFKTRLDKYWSHQPLLYDFKAKIAGTGDQSKCENQV